jgi:hypothetical protein
MEAKIKEDIKLIRIARELQELDIFDGKTSSLLLFEAV